MGDLEAGDVHELFLRLAADDHAGFVDSCAEGIVVIIRHGAESLSLGRADLGSWFEEQQRDETGATLCSLPSVVHKTGQHAVVILSHALRREGVNWQYQTINQCEFDDGRLSRWTVSPVNLLEYAQAWNLLAVDRLLPA